MENSDNTVGAKSSAIPGLEDLIRLEDICEPLLGLSFVIARRYHALNKLALKAFRLGNARRGPLYVHKDDITAHIEKRRRESSRAR